MIHPLTCGSLRSKLSISYILPLILNWGTFSNWSNFWNLQTDQKWKRGLRSLSTSKEVFLTWDSARSLRKSLQKLKLRKVFQKRNTGFCWVAKMDNAWSTIVFLWISYLTDWNNLVIVELHWCSLCLWSITWKN